MIQKTISILTNSLEECMNTEKLEANWIQQIKNFIANQDSKVEYCDRSLAQKVPWLFIIGHDFYKRGYSTPLLRFLMKESKYVMKEPT